MIKFDNFIKPLKVTLNSQNPLCRLSNTDCSKLLSFGDRCVAQIIHNLKNEIFWIDILLGWREVKPEK